MSDDKNKSKSKSKQTNNNDNTNNTSNQRVTTQAKEKNEVRDWLNENDKNGILANVIGKYDKFNHIANLFFTKERLVAAFTNDEGHLVGKLMKHLQDKCNWPSSRSSM